MKKNILAIAIATAFAAPIVSADAPVVYGQINAGIVDKATPNATGSTFASGSSVDSIASRFGIKGSEDLGNGLKAIYKIEFGIDVADAKETDAGDKISGISNRNQYVGLAGGFGTVLMGRHDTPEKMSQASDLFNDGAADLKNKNLVGGVAVNEIRADDVLAYVSPSFSGVKLIAAAVMAEETSSTSKNDALSVAITYGSKKKGLYLAAAMTDFDNKTLNDTTRISAQYKVSGITANVIFIDSKDATSGDLASEGSVTQVNLGYKIGKFTPKLKISQVDYKLAASSDHTNTAIGLNYALGKKTTAYVEIVDATSKNLEGTDTTTIGLLHKF